MPPDEEKVAELQNLVNESQAKCDAAQQKVTTALKDGIVQEPLQPPVDMAEHQGQEHVFRAWAVSARSTVTKINKNNKPT